MQIEICQSSAGAKGSYQSRLHTILACYLKYDSDLVQVLFSRYVGEVRQGRWFDPVRFEWPNQAAEVKSLLLNGKQTEPDYRKHAMQVLSNLQCEVVAQSVLATDKEP